MAMSRSLRSFKFTLAQERSVIIDCGRTSVLVLLRECCSVIMTLCHLKDILELDISTSIATIKAILMPMSADSAKVISFTFCYTVNLMSLAMTCYL